MAELTGSYNVTLAASDSAGGVASIANPEGAALIITGIFIHLTTASTGACTLDAGVGSGATTSYDTLIDGASAATAGVLNNIKNGGTNGLGAVPWAAANFLTISKASGATAGLVGTVYIQYIRQV